LILRLKIGEVFKEFHVKVFNTGKLEIPGIQREEDFQKILKYIIVVLKPLIKNTTEDLDYKKNSTETVLINSNFNCGYYINREVFYDILKYKYNIQAIYDPCSYPGIQCKFYYNPDVEIQTGSQISEENKALYTCIQEVSFMIFRTGSVLIVGKCDENVLLIIYEFLKIILNNEYKEICQKNLKTNENSDTLKNKKKKIRKKTILINTNI
jgi:TATA-box binding protein (TBP) (component of TFIID and TFIIIB)